MCKIRLPSNTNTTPLFVPSGGQRVITGLIKVIQCNTVTHPYNTITRYGYISYERQFEWLGRAKSTYDNVKTKIWKVFLQVFSIPCKCCSRSQQRSSPGLRLSRLTELLVFIERVWWKVLYWPPCIMEDGDIARFIYCSGPRTVPCQTCRATSSRLWRCTGAVSTDRRPWKSSIL